MTTSDRDEDALVIGLANVLIKEGAAKKRSLTYTQLLQLMGKASEYDSPARRLMTTRLLPKIARQCHLCSQPILSSLAVSATTRKPEGWFRIFVVDQAKLFQPQDERSWREFVDREQRSALAYWATARRWVP